MTKLKNGTIPEKNGAKKTYGWGRKARRAAGYLALCLLLAASAQMCVLASGTGQTITAGIGNLQNIVASFVSAVGSIIVLWDIFEIGLPQSHWLLPKACCARCSRRHSKG